MSKRERDRLLSSLQLIVHHLLKWDYQPQRRSRSWLETVEVERSNIKSYLKDSPSLKRFLTDTQLSELYPGARIDAFKDIGLDFPADCPYGIDDVLTRLIQLG